MKYASKYNTKKQIFSLLLCVRPLLLYLIPSRKIIYWVDLVDCPSKLQAFKEVTIT
jgi:hypothetical protein